MHFCSDELCALLGLSAVASTAMPWVRHQLGRLQAVWRRGEP